MPVSITGMHRSGTSMITRLLMLSGLYLGEENELMNSASDNPEGFWEHLRFTKINDEALNILGAGWDYFPPHIQDGWEHTPALHAAHVAASNLVLEFSSHPSWGWKDPRNSLTLPFWKMVIPDLKFVVCIRNPLEVAGSLHKRGSASMNFSLNLWLLYNKLVFKSLSPGSYIVTNYETYFSNPTEELKRLLGFLEIPIDIEAAQQVCSSIRPSLQHHHLSADDIKTVDSPYRDEVLDMYERLLLLSQQSLAEIKREEAVANASLQTGTSPANENQVYLNSHIIQLEKETAKQASIIKQKDILINQQKREIEELYASSSWRVTAPLRSAGSFARSLFEKIYMLLIRYQDDIPISNRMRTKLQKQFIGKYPIYDADEMMRNFDKKRSEFIEITENYYATHLRAAFTVPPPTEPLVTIIVPVFNQLKHTVQCLLSIADSPDKTSFEILVIDDLSSDETKQVLEGIASIRYIRNETNLGFLRSCNKAASLARGKYILLLNNDTFVLPFWLDSLVETFENFPQAGLVGSKLLNSDKTLQEAGGIIWGDGTGWNYGRGDSPNKPQYNYLREVDYCSGASIMLPKTIWDELNGFDEIYAPAYYEDTDLAFRVRGAGYQVFYQPASQVVHFEGVSSGKDITTGIKRYQEINRTAFVSRWEKQLAGHGSSQSIGRSRPASRYAKGHILFIDSVTPTPDQDSGSIDAFNFMCMLRKFGYEVSFIPSLNLLHHGSYTRELQKNGVECQYYPYIVDTEDYIRKHKKRFDLVFVSRLPVAAQFMRHIKKKMTNAKVIFNTVDLHFLREERRSQLLGNSKQQAQKMKRLEISLMKQADCSVVVSEHELNILNELDPTIDAAVLPIPRYIPGRRNDFSNRRDIVFLGGYQHQPNIDAVHYFMREIWPIASKQLPFVNFVIAGSNLPDEFNQYQAANVVLQGYVENLDEFLGACRLTVAPLRFGAGVKGKIVTSLSHGVPCVATTIAAEGMGLEHGTHILCSDSPLNFAEHMIKLYTDSALWFNLSENGLDLVRNRYSISVVENKFLSLLDKVLNNKK